MNNCAYLGIIERGKFRPLATEHDTADSCRLTTVAVNGDPPESGELSLVKYEGSAILVRGLDKDEWIYSAVVIEQAGFILTAVVQQVFSSTGKPHQHRLRPPLI